MDQQFDQKNTLNSNLLLGIGLIVILILLTVSSLFLYFNIQRVEKKINIFIEQTTKAAQSQASGSYTPNETSVFPSGSGTQSNPTPRSSGRSQPPPPAPADSF